MFNRAILRRKAVCNKNNELERTSTEYYIWRSRVTYLRLPESHLTGRRAVENLPNRSEFYLTRPDDCDHVIARYVPVILVVGLPDCYLPVTSKVSAGIVCALLCYDSLITKR